MNPSNKDKELTVEAPEFISCCEREERLEQSMIGMLKNVIQNIDFGYQIELSEITENLQNGMTLKSFNMLALNINNLMSAQYNRDDDSIYSKMMQYPHGGIH